MSRLQVTKEQFKEVVALNNNFPFGMLAAGIAVTAASAVECADNDCNAGEGEVLGVVAGSLLVFFNLVYIYLIYNGLLGERNDSLYSILLFIGWTVTSAYLTFEAPFNVAGNGFVAAWLGFISSLGNLIYNVRFADNLKEKLVSQGLPLGVLLIGSAIVVIAGLSNGCCDEGEVIAVIAGSISLLFVVLRIFIGPKYNRIFGLFLATWWTILGLLITFDEFKEIGNGFIATWLCIIASYFLISDATISRSALSARVSAKRGQFAPNNEYKQKEPMADDDGEEPIAELF